MAEGATKEFTNTIAAVGKGIYDGAVNGVTTVARGAIDAGRKALEVATDLSSEAAENFVHLGMKALLTGSMELGGSIASGGIEAVTTAAKSLPEAGGHLGSGLAKLAMPASSASVVATQKDSDNLTALGTLPKPVIGAEQGSNKRSIV